jgi:2'-5' RNA ligase
MRAFLSYDIEEDSIRSRIKSLQEELASSGADLKLVNPELIHFTVRFLGEIDEDQKNSIISSLSGKIRPIDREVRFQGIGVFPNESRISVIWIGIDQDSGKAIAASAKDVNSRLKGLGPFHEDTHNEFSPHLTISRVKSGRNKEALLEFIRGHNREEYGSSRIGPLRLKLSTLSPSGPSYSDLYVFK